MSQFNRVSCPSKKIGHISFRVEIQYRSSISSNIHDRKIGTNKITKKF